MNCQENTLYPTVRYHMWEALRCYHNGPIDPRGFDEYLDYIREFNDGLVNLYVLAEDMDVRFDDLDNIVSYVYFNVRNELGLDNKQADVLIFGRTKNDMPSALYLEFERLVAQVSGKPEQEVRRDYQRYLRMAAHFYRKDNEYSVYAIYDFVDTYYYMYRELWAFAIEHVKESEGRPR